MSFDDTFDALLLESFMNRLQLNSQQVNTGSNVDDVLSTVLNPSLPLISSAPDVSDDSGLGYVAKEEAKVEREIVRTILSGHTESLRPNSGQPVTIGEHNICVGCSIESGSDYRVWEWHGHVMTYDEENCYSLEYIYGNYFERMPERCGERKEDEESRRGGLGLRGLIGNDSSNSGRIARRNVNVGSPRSNA
ncbi:hypothetical protein CKAN_01033500 [Cinnamomum micranthum f. kanehirae]|uniref:FK506-binding protein 5-like protein n=1 Tax=Cinnamomum micranthum f. kanehirae TaxID=337451 RepID=A0A3S3MSK3_9MAGN|nr:hypothetical protein CKAN_01033500 [Cinnamomum micranthum f. kanehirae]